MGIEVNAAPIKPIRYDIALVLLNFLNMTDSHWGTLTALTQNP